MEDVGMSTKLKHQEGKAEGGNVVVLSKCSAEGCGKKTDRLTFCTEHYDWFKWGLLTKEGQRPSDFDKKYQSYMKKRAA
jgi:hypothetical protein